MNDFDDGGITDNIEIKSLDGSPPHLNPRLYLLVAIAIVMLILSFAINISVNMYYDNLSNQNRAENRALIIQTIDRKIEEFKKDRATDHKKLEGKLDYLRRKMYEQHKQIYNKY